MAWRTANDGAAEEDAPRNEEQVFDDARDIEGEGVDGVVAVTPWLPGKAERDHTRQPEQIYKRSDGGVSCW